MQKLRLCFAGTPEFAAAHLSALIDDATHDIVGVYTQPDRPAGRGKKLQPSPVKLIAEQHNLALFQPQSLKSDEVVNQFADLAPDLLIVVAYGLILPASFLAVPDKGCINVHASLLPRWRGAAPIERAILAGDKESGVTIMQMDAGLDTGAMLASRKTKIADTDDRVSLEKKIQIAGIEALLEVLDDLETYQSRATLQDDTASTYAAKVDKSEALIDWRLSATQINRIVRAGTGRFPAYTHLGSNRIRIILATTASGDFNVQPGTIVDVTKDSFSVVCGVGALLVKEVQLPGKNIKAVKDMLNSQSNEIQPGKQFTDSPESS